MKHLHVLLLCGGGGSEHEISLLSANFLESQLKSLADVSVTRVELFPDHWQTNDGRFCHLGMDRQLHFDNSAQPVDFCGLLLCGGGGSEHEISLLSAIFWKVS